MASQRKTLASCPDSTYCTLTQLHTPLCTPFNDLITISSPRNDVPCERRCFRAVRSKQSETHRFNRVRGQFARVLAPGNVSGGGLGSFLLHRSHRSRGTSSTGFFLGRPGWLQGPRARRDGQKTAGTKRCTGLVEFGVRHHTLVSAL